MEEFIELLDLLTNEQIHRMLLDFWRYRTTVEVKNVKRWIKDNDPELYMRQIL